MYSLRVREELDKKFAKMANNDPAQLKIINKKVAEVLKNPHRYKNLRAPLNDRKRVHIDRHFMLTFSIDEGAKTVILEDYEHHDRIYRH